MDYSRLRQILLPFLLSGSMVSAAVFEENFQAYPDFSPVMEHWMYRGVAGEVIGGAYLFTGVNQKSSEYWDVNPEDAQMLVRAFPAGSAVAVTARFTAMPHKFKVFQPGKKTDQRGGLLIHSRPFQRKTPFPAEQPYLSLFLNKKADGTRSFELQYCGKPAIPLKSELAEQGTWKEGTEYRLELVLKGDSAEGTVWEGDRILWRKTLRSPEFRTIFRKAYPGFRNYRMTGKLSYFKADNLNSEEKKNAVQSLAVPEVWKTADGKTVRFQIGKKVDLAKLFAGRSGEKVVTLRAAGSVASPGEYALKGNADWFWKIVCNGKTVADFMRQGNGKGGHVVILPLEKGDYQLELTVKAGSSGWVFAFEQPSAEEIRQQILRKHTYGSDVLVWNLDRLIDDFSNLKRHGLSLLDVERDVLALRSSIPADLEAAEIRKYDPLLDRAYGRVYDAYRCLELEDSISELREFNPAIAELPALEKCAADLRKLVASGSSVESAAQKAQNLLDAARKRMNGFAEGVTKGGSFGRFGWVTSSFLGDYSSGDGLLANQVLSTGAIARQYVFSPANPKLYWQIPFRFEGARDSAVEKRLKNLPVTGPNAAVEFGYDPTQFYSGSTPEAVKVNAVSWTRKQFTCADAFTADMNLLSPSLLLESAHREFVLSDSPTGAFTNIAWRSGTKEILSLPVKEDGVLYDRGRDGELASNWIVLWNGNSAEQDLTGHRGSVPVQVIFQRRPRSIVRKNHEIRIQFDRGGAVWLNTLYGAPLQATGNWRGNLPFACAGAADFAARAALAQPIDCREFYRYDAEKNTVTILNKYKFREFTENDWNLKPLKIALLPPVLSLMADRGFDVLLPENLRNLNYPTIYGPLYGVEGSEISYTLPVPYVPQYSIARNPEANAEDVALLVRHGMDNLEGAKFRLFDERLSRSWHSVNFPAGEATKVWQYFSPEYQAYLKGLFRYLTEISPGYRTNRVWRSLTEPYSGKKYYYSFSIGADYPGDVGVFGDRGYGVGLHLHALELWTSLTGNNDLLKSLWRDNAPLATPDAIRDGKFLTVDKMLGYVKNVHDWAWMDDGSNDSGDNGPVVDCSQAPFAGHSAYFRMAKRVGNEREIAKGTYHLAKSQLALIARPAFLDYGRDHGLIGVDHVNVGFREFITPNSFSNQNMHASNERDVYVGSYASLFAYAGRDDGFDIFHPYAKYVWNDLRRFRDLCGQYFPNGDSDSFQMNAPLESSLLFRIFDGEPLSRIRKIYNNMNAKTIFYIRNQVEKNILPLLLTGGCPLLLTEWHPVPLPDFEFRPSAKKAIVRIPSVPGNYVLGALSSRNPSVVKINGKSGKWNYDSSTHRLQIPVPAGKDRVVEIFFDEIDPDRFTPFPLPEVKSRRPAVVAPDSLLDYRRASVTKKPVQAKVKPAIPEKLLSRFPFDGEPGKGNAGFGFHDWSKQNIPPRGGITGAYPGGGKPARTLEVCASQDNFSGFGSAFRKVPARTKKLIITGKVFRSADYKGNTPMIFLWLVTSDGKESPVFFRPPRAANGIWQEFRFECKGKDLPEKIQKFALNLTSQRTPEIPTVGGSVFYRDIQMFTAEK